MGQKCKPPLLTTITVAQSNCIVRFRSASLRHFTGTLAFDSADGLCGNTNGQTSAPPLTRLSRLNIRRRQNVFVAAWHDIAIGRSTVRDVSACRLSGEDFVFQRRHEGHGPITEHFRRLLEDRFINVSWQRRQLRYANSKPSERCRIHRECTFPSIQLPLFCFAILVTA